MLRKTRAKTRTDASQASSAPETDRSTAVGPSCPFAASTAGRKTIDFTRCSCPRLAQRSAPTCRGLDPRVAPYFGSTQRPGLTCFTGIPRGVSLDVGSPRLKRRSPQSGHESRRDKRRSPEPRTAQHHDCRAVASFVSARVSPSFISRPCGGDRFEMREGQHRNPEILVEARLGVSS